MCISLCQRIRIRPFQARQRKISNTPAKRATNVSIRGDQLDAARQAKINLSSALETALVVQLAAEKRKQWRHTIVSPSVPTTIRSKNSARIPQAKGLWSGAVHCLPKQKRAVQGHSSLSARYPSRLTLRSADTRCDSTNQVTRVEQIALSQLSPVLSFEGDRFVLMTPLFAGIATSELGAAVGNLASERSSSRQLIFRVRVFRSSVQARAAKGTAQLDLVMNS